MDGGPPIIADTSPSCRIASEQHPSPLVTQPSVLPGDHLTTERCYLPSKVTNIHYIQILQSTLPLHCSVQLAVIAGSAALFLSACSDEH